MQETFRTIARNGTEEIEIKKSRFIGTVTRVTDETAARSCIDAIRQQNWDASHNCTAYCIGERSQFQRTSDDGEPSGTAGIPMLEVLKRREITNTVAVVTRYFGGTRLGAGGLIRAYGQAVSAAINAVGIVECKPLAIVTVAAGHHDAGRLENALRTTDYEMGSVVYGADVRFELYLDSPDIPGFESWIAEATNGQCHTEIIGHRYVEIPVFDVPE